VTGRDGSGTSVDMRWTARASGLFFQDVPSLPLEGHQAFYIAYLVGVRNDGMCEVLAKKTVANRDDFVFRWAYRQTRRNAPSGSGVFIRLENADDSVPGAGEGEVTFLGFGDGGVTVVGPEGGFDQDGDADGYGDLCDGDYDGDGNLNFTDLAIMREFFPGPSGYYDLDGDGLLNFTDLAILRSRFFQAPGPSPIAE